MAEEKRKRDMREDGSIPGREAEKHFHEEVRGIKKICEKDQGQGRGPNNCPEGVTRRGTHLTSDQIREEYGIGAHPYPVATQNVLAALLKADEPLTLQGIAEVIGNGYSPGKLTGTVSRLYFALADNEIERELISAPGGGSYGYQLLDKSKSVEELYELYLQGNRSRKQQKKITSPKAKPEETSDLARALTRHSDLLEKLLRDGVEIKVQFTD